MVRPMSRKDIFYSGSVTNLKEYQSQKSLTDYRNSVISLTKFERDHRHDTPTQQHYQDVERSDACPCLPPAFKAALSSMLDVTLLKDPAFMLIAISNLFGMAALYIPFFYLVDAATKNVSLNFLLQKGNLFLSFYGCHNENFIEIFHAFKYLFRIFYRVLRKVKHRCLSLSLALQTRSLVSSAATCQTFRVLILCSSIIVA